MGRCFSRPEEKSAHGSDRSSASAGTSDHRRHSYDSQSVDSHELDPRHRQQQRYGAPGQQQHKLSGSQLGYYRAVGIGHGLLFFINYMHQIINQLNHKNNLLWTLNLYKYGYNNFIITIRCRQPLCLSAIPGGATPIPSTSSIS
jgi:hypothetical protein